MRGFAASLTAGVLLMPVAMPSGAAARQRPLWCAPTPAFVDLPCAKPVRRPVRHLRLPVSGVGTVTFGRLRWHHWGRRHAWARGRSRYHDRDIGTTAWERVRIDVSGYRCMGRMEYRETRISAGFMAGTHYTGYHCGE